MAQDEGRFGRINCAVKCWAPKQVRPVVGAQIVREHIYAYAAACPKNGKVSTLILPYANTEMMNLFLKPVSIDFSDYFVIIQVDGAAWHRAHSLQIPENIRLIQQPPYSPELNPVEHIWDDIREKEFANRAFGSIKAVMDALCSGIQRLIGAPDYVKSMTGFPHIINSL